MGGVKKSPHRCRQLFSGERGREGEKERKKEKTVRGSRVLSALPLSKTPEKQLFFWKNALLLTTALCKGSTYSSKSHILIYSTATQNNAMEDSNVFERYTVIAKLERKRK